jgi:hypothetical protein
MENKELWLSIPNGSVDCSKNAKGGCCKRGKATPERTTD